MALIACKECKAQISSEAKSCPQCGAAPPKKTSMATWFVGGLMVFVVGSMIVNANRTEVPYQTTATQGAAPVRAAIAAPPPPKSPEVLREITRLRALTPETFCTKELRKAKGLKGAWPQPWGEAVLEVIKAHDVTSAHLDSIKEGGAVVGMSRCGALASWGKPESVNTTTSARGTREQWVYGGRNYLYFVGDVLTTIQN